MLIKNMTESNTKSPQECESMQDVRRAIDCLDEQLLDLLAKRISYIERAADIKTSIETIRDDERIESIIAKRKSQASEHGYSEEFIEATFRQLIEYSVAHEMKLFKQKDSKS